jgi:ABC-type lipoprotein export system ATPase subunit
MNDPLLSARALRKAYGRGDTLVRAVDDVDLDIAAGETVAVTGPSGCGKSTLLHLLGGLDRPDAGQVILSGRQLGRLGERGLARLRRDVVGFVFQGFHLMDELTAVENATAGQLRRKAGDHAAGQPQPGGRGRALDHQLRHHRHRDRAGHHGQGHPDREHDPVVPVSRFRPSHPHRSRRGRPRQEAR